MATLKNKDATIQLEKKCPRCDGAGGSKRDYDNVWDRCVQCGGSGYLTTAMGERILSLIEHNLKEILVRGSQNILSER
jgi:DnaJ-class molecular chaperone